MGDDPVLTVAIPAYGDSPYLREAVASVLAQDCPDWSLVVVDDGPRDELLAGWLAALDPRVTYEHNPRRLGINRNFQRCLEAAASELVVLLGADDRLLPGYVRTMSTAAAANPGAAWLHPGVRVIDGAGAPVAPLADRLKRLLALPAPALVSGETLAASLLRGNWMYLPSVTFRTEVARRHGFRPGHDIVLDLDLYLRLLVAGESAMLIDVVCFEYRRHEASLSSSERLTGARFDEERYYFAETARTMERAGWPRAARASRRHVTSRLHAATLLPGSLLRGRWGAAGGLARHIVARTGRGPMT